jgi:hypothetical protein
VSVDTWGDTKEAECRHWEEGGIGRNERWRLVDIAFIPRQQPFMIDVQYMRGIKVPPHKKSHRSKSLNQ